MDFNKLVNDSKAALDRNNSTRKENTPKNDIKMVYPANAGVIEFRLLPNNKANAVQRLIARHKIPDSSNQWGSKNIICRNAHYGEDCPICKAIAAAKIKCGDDCDAFRKFGFKKRGIAYAIITKIGPEYKDIKVGDLVLLMYPKSVHDEISNQIVNNASNLEYIFNQNEGCTFVLETKKAANGFPEYAVKLNVGFNGPVMVKARATQEEYDALLESLPNLNDVMVPSVEPDTLYNDALAAADLVNVTYGCVSEAVATVNKTNGKTLGTLDIVDEPAPAPVKTTGWNANPVVNTGWNTTPAQTTTTTSGNPECFGNHEDGSSKCNLCPHELECMGVC